MHHLLKASFKIHNFKKQSKTGIMLGCSGEEFKLYIENQFEEWMNWDNHGTSNKYNDKWQYDHIYPIGLAKDTNELKILNYYLNFRPFCALKNNKKNDKIDYELINNNKELKEYLIKNKIINI